MENDIESFGPPIRGRCRICGEQCYGPVTVCVDHAKLVYERMGGSRDHHVRAYIKLKAAEDAETLAAVLARTEAARAELLAKPQPGERCSCGRMYFKYIAVLACEARDHQSPPQPSQD